jgi:outer membrane protein OmpA-like peptidoglycan-associated protein
MKPKEVIREIYKVLNENPDILILQVSGHSDFSEKDSTLSKKRALKITQKLVSMGINHSRLNPVGYGDKKPVVKQSEIISFVDKKEIRAAQLMNRRVEFLISKMKMR